MAKNIKQSGMMILEITLAFIILQIFMLMTYPSMMSLIKQKQTRYLLEQLQYTIDWARWMAVIRHEKLSLEPIGQWQNGWKIFTDQKLLREFKVFHFGEISVQWHGFTGKGPLIFYPKMASNHLNGYFQIGHQKLWLNRLGHMRVAYAI